MKLEEGDLVINQNEVTGIVQRATHGCEPYRVEDTWGFYHFGIRFDGSSTLNDDIWKRMEIGINA